MEKIGLGFVILILCIFLCSARSQLKGTSQKVATTQRITVEEVTIDTCVYHVFVSDYQNVTPFVIRVK